MKQILCILAVSLVIYSCQKKTPEITAPETNIGFSKAWDSFKLEYNAFYHVVLRRSFAVDSNVGLRIHSASSFTEYLTMTDTNGLHLVDSTTYAPGSVYSELQSPDPNYYLSSVGYVYSRFSPIGGSLSGVFLLHDLMVKDTLILRTGIPTQYNAVAGTLRRPGTDTVTTMTIYR